VFVLGGLWLGSQWTYKELYNNKAIFITEKEQIYYSKVLLLIISTFKVEGLI
jgi:hypothetical protein